MIVDFVTGKKLMTTSINAAGLMIAKIPRAASESSVSTPKLN